MSTWKIDPVHSEIKFKVKHLVVSNVTGQFRKFDAEIESNQRDFSDARIRVDIDVNTIDTRNEQRDGHLKSPDFFDAASHTRMTFLSKSVTKKSDNNYIVLGDLTIRGTTKEVTLDVTYNGSARSFDGSEVVGFEAVGKLNRFDFGLHWNAITEAGSIVVGDEVKIEIAAEFVLASEARKAA
ncbi:MAG TPA: YceI family protein [Candidatus Kryptonia bacterium]